MRKLESYKSIASKVLFWGLHFVYFIPNRVDFHINRQIGHLSNARYFSLSPGIIFALAFIHLLFFNFYYSYFALKYSFDLSYMKCHQKRQKQIT